MSESFDPYYKWLGISPGEQKNYYRLLGLNLYESDRDVIENLADQRIAAIRNYQLKFPKEATNILNELSKARVTLLDLKKKKEYDEELQRSLNNGYISVNEPPVITRPPKLEEFQQTQKPISTGEIPVTTRPPKPEEFQIPTGEIPVTTPPPKPEEYQQLQHSNDSIANNLSLLNHDVSIPISYDVDFQHIIDDKNANLNDSKIIFQELPDQNNFSESCIGYLDTVARINNVTIDLEAKFKDYISIIHEQRAIYEKKQKDEIQKLKTAFWNEMRLFFIVPGIIVCILFLWYPLFACPILLSLPILYIVIQHFSIQESVHIIEDHYRPRFNNLDQDEAKINEKYNAILESPELRINFTRQQIDFLDKLSVLFYNTNKGEEIVCMKPINYGAQIKNQYSKACNVYFKDMVPNNLLNCSLPTIIIEERILFFFPQGILIEDNGNFFEISYDNITISQYKNCRTVEMDPKNGADVADTFWKHTRVDGMRDRRFKDNPQYYIVRYWGVQIKSNSLFLSDVIYFSSKERSKIFIKELTALIRKAPISPRIS